MIRRICLFLGLFLMLPSLWSILLITIEETHGWIVTSKYAPLEPLDEIQKDHEYLFKGKRITLETQNIQQEKYQDGFSQLPAVKADIIVKIDGQTVMMLKEKLVTVDKKDSNSYSTRKHVKAILVTDHDDNSQFVEIIGNTTKIPYKVEENGVIYDLTHVEEQSFENVTLYANGKIKKETFSYKNKGTYFQTWLALFVSPTSFGHYTNIGYGYPTLVVIYPFGTFVLGAILIVFWWIKRRREKV